MKVLLMNFQMLRQFYDAFRENCHLNFRGACVSVVGLEQLNYFLFLFFLDHGKKFLRLKIFYFKAKTKAIQFAIIIAVSVSANILSQSV